MLTRGNVLENERVWLASPEYQTRLGHQQQPQKQHTSSGRQKVKKGFRFPQSGKTVNLCLADYAHTLTFGTR